MYIVDYDDFYSLTDYAGQFSAKPNEEVRKWLSSRATLSLIELWELEKGNPDFRKGNVDYYIERIANGEILDPAEVVAALNLSGLSVQNGNVAADKTIYYDFVQYLTESGKNVGI